MCTVSELVMRKNPKPILVRKVMWQIMRKSQGNKGVEVDNSSCLQSALIEQCLLWRESTKLEAVSTAP